MSPNYMYVTVVYETICELRIDEKSVCMDAGVSPDNQDDDMSLVSDVSEVSKMSLQSAQSEVPVQRRNHK